MSFEQTAITLDDIAKTFRLYPRPLHRLLHQLPGLAHLARYQEIKGLKPLSLSIPTGEVIGLVGRNGAGKSTLLQLVCHTLSPSQGTVSVNGKIAALLELGAGFNPEFTGRENVYMSAAIMGMSRSEIADRFAEIHAFSGIGDFIDQPVKTYSSGMLVRLAFSVATSVDPDILVVDEALSVGDGAFARQSFDRIMAMRDAGKTILFCSHSLYQIEVLCNRVIWMEAGQIVEDGPPEKVVPNYQSHLDRLSLSQQASAEAKTTPTSSSASSSTSSSASSSASPSSPATAGETAAQASSVRPGRTRLTSVTVLADDTPGSELEVNSESTELRIDVAFVTHRQEETPGIAVVFHAESGLLVSSCGSWDDGVSLTVDDQGQGRASVTFSRLPLLKGRYRVGVLLFCENGVFVYDEADPVATLNVTQKGVNRGLVSLPRSWQVSAPGHAPAPGARADSRPSSAHDWRVENARDASEPLLLALFERCFGHSISSATWHWKYRYTEDPGTVVYDDSRLVAFNGGMPRRALMMGEPVTAVQMGDVMVAPEARGVLTRRGPFYRVVEAYFRERVGPDKPYRLAFGFPHARHARLGTMLGLYCQTDRILDARWPGLNGRNWQYGLAPLTETDGARVDQLWRAMAADAGELVIGCRDSEWLGHRYLHKPHNDYRVLLATHRVTRRPLGVLVLRVVDETQVELLDIVAPRSHVSALVAMARRQVMRLGRQTLIAWLTPQAAAWFADSRPETAETDVVVPGAAVNQPEYALKAQHRWWLMGGDTDFK